MLTDPVLSWEPWALHPGCQGGEQGLSPASGGPSWVPLPVGLIAGSLSSPSTLWRLPGPSHICLSPRPLPRPTLLCASLLPMETQASQLRQGVRGLCPQGKDLPCAFCYLAMLVLGSFIHRH